MMLVSHRQFQWDVLDCDGIPHKVSFLESFILVGKGSGGDSRVPYK